MRLRIPLLLLMTMITLDYRPALAQCTCPPMQDYTGGVFCSSGVTKVRFTWDTDGCSPGTYDIHWRHPNGPWNLLEANATPFSYEEDALGLEWSNRTIHFKITRTTNGCSQERVESAMFNFIPHVSSVTAQMVSATRVRVDWSPDYSDPDPVQLWARIYRDQDVNYFAQVPWRDGDYEFDEPTCGNHTYSVAMYLSDAPACASPKGTSGTVSFNNVPALLSPPDGYQYAPCTPFLRWAAACGAQKYRVEISRDPDFNVLWFSGAIPAPVTEVDIGLATEPDITHYWRVRSCNTAETVCSDWSQVRSYLRPGIDPPGPLNASDDQQGTKVTLTWTNVPGEEGYRIYRDNAVIKTLGAEISTWEDLDAPFGDHYYCVAAIMCGGFETEKACDFGHMPFDPRPRWYASPDRDLPAAEGAAAYDPMRNRMLTFGGYSSIQMNPNNRMWTLQLPPLTGGWTEHDLQGIVPGAPIPSSRYGAGMVYLPEFDAISMYGGSGPGNGDLWVVYPHTEIPASSNPSWSHPSGHTGTNPTGSTKMTYDTMRGRMIVTSPNQGVFACEFGQNLPAWSTIWEGSLVPYAGQEGASIAYDPLNDRLLIFGGWKNALPPTVANQYVYPNVYGLSLANPGAGWSVVATGGPGALADGSLVYDSEAQRMLFYGGERGYRTTASAQTINGAVWALSLAGASTWTQLSMAGSQTPPPRFRHTAVFGNDMMTVFGGTNGGSVFKDTWYMRPNDITPPAAVTGLYIDYIGETTAGVAWTAPGDDGNSNQAAAYDIRFAEFQITEATFEMASRFINVPPPGLPGNPQTAETSQLRSCTLFYFAMKTGDEAGNWSPMSNVVSATTMGLGCGGGGGGGQETRAQKAEIAPRDLSLAVLQSPGSRAVIRYTLDGVPGETGHDLTVFDVTGRLCRHLGSSLARTGTGEIAWDQKDDQGARLAAGVYFIKLKGLKTAITRKVLVLN